MVDIPPASDMDHNRYIIGTPSIRTSDGHRTDVDISWSSQWDLYLIGTTSVYHRYLTIRIGICTSPLSRRRWHHNTISFVSAPRQYLVGIAISFVPHWRRYPTGTSPSSASVLHQCVTGVLCSCAWSRERRLGVCWDKSEKHRY